MQALILIVLCLAVFLIERFSLQQPEDGLRVKAFFEDRLSEPGEQINLRITAENRGWMPLFFLQLTFSLPKGLNPTDEAWRKGHCRDMIGTRTVAETIYLMPHQKLTLKIPLQAEHRGWYMIGNVFITGGDFLGLKTTITSQAQEADLVVMPAKADLAEKAEAIGGFFGNASVRRWLFEDPIITAGYADYTGREPMKNIAWAQSARLNRLTVRQFDHTAENTVAVILDMDDADEESAERCFSAARTVVEMLEEKHMTWSFLSNGNLQTSIGGRFGDSGGQGRMHLNFVLEMLGRANYGTYCSFEQLTEKILHGISSSHGYIVIVPYERMKNSPEIHRLSAATGGMVYTIGAGGERA